MNIKVEIPSIPNLHMGPINMPKVSIPKVNLSTCSIPKQRPIFQETDAGYKEGYNDGYSGSSNLSEGKDIVNNDHWLGYSCGYRDGRFDRENGNPANC